MHLFAASSCSRYARIAKVHVSSGQGPGSGPDALLSPHSNQTGNGNIRPAITRVQASSQYCLQPPTRSVWNPPAAASSSHSLTQIISTRKTFLSALTLLLQYHPQAGFPRLGSILKSQACHVSSRQAVIPQRSTEVAAAKARGSHPPHLQLHHPAPAASALGEGPA